LRDSQKEDLYAKLDIGADSWIDYSTTTFGAVLDTSIPLRNLGLREIIPVDLNSIWYASAATELAIADFHQSRGNHSAHRRFQAFAFECRDAMDAIYDLLFSEIIFRHLDYNILSHKEIAIGWTGTATNLTQGIRFYPQQF
jgi:neutral trehalase